LVALIFGFFSWRCTEPFEAAALDLLNLRDRPLMPRPVDLRWQLAGRFVDKD
jgi:hypothetical protein